MFSASANTVFSTSKAAGVALWLCLFGSLGAVSWEVYRDVTSLKSSSAPSAPHKAPPAKAANPTVNLSELHLFGNPGSQPVAKAQQNIPDTRLQLELKGAFTSSNTASASALVSEKGKTAKRYYVNDSLPGGAVLTQVDSDHITLSRGGNLEVLRFPKPASSGVESTRNVAANGSPRNNSQQQRSTQRNSQTSQSRTESIKERLLRLRQNKN
jgi:type II secretory pathway component PulC